MLFNAGKVKLFFHCDYCKIVLSLEFDEEKEHKEIQSVKDGVIEIECSECSELARFLWN